MSTVQFLRQRLAFRSALRAAPFLVYLAVILFVLPDIISWIHRVIFLAYGLFILWVLKDDFSDTESPSDETVPYKKLWIIILIFSLLFLVASRLYMFIRYGPTPLGYDTGFYWQYFNQIISYGTSQGYLGGGNVAYVAWFPYHFLGLSNISVINLFHLFHQSITAGALYFLIRSLRLRVSSLSALAVTLLLFALSINQFMAFWWIFYKQSLALPFLLLATGLFLRRSSWAIPVATFGAAIHLQSAIPFGIAFFIFFIYQIVVHFYKKQPLDRELLYIGLSGMAAGLLLVIIKSPQDLLGYIEYFKKYGGFASNARNWEVQQAKGLFISSTTFWVNTIFYLPFALAGIFTMPSWLCKNEINGRIISIPILLVVTSLLASFPFLYQNRTLILLDFLLILFATYPIIIFVKKFIHDHTGQLILGILGLGLIFFTARVIWNNPPQIYPDEISEIKAITQLRKPGDYAMALTSLYTPWVHAYTNFQETIAPGWLSWDRWDIKMWQEFWNGDSNARRLEFLSIYGDHDIYMFAGKYFTPHPNLKKFLETDPHMTKLSPHVWKYSP